MDLALELIREDWKHRKEVIGVRKIIETYMSYLHTIKHPYFKNTVQRVFNNCIYSHSLVSMGIVSMTPKDTKIQNTQVPYIKWLSICI